MIHHFDYRWATYGGGAVEDEESARDITLAEKQNPQFEPTPRYWVPEEEVKIRASRIPASVKRAYRDANPDRCLKALAEWIVGFFQLVEGRDAREADLIQILGKDRSWRTVLGASIDRFLLTPRTKATGREIQFETPLCRVDLAFMENGPDEPIALVEALIERKQPRWLMGWRDICRSTDERTVIGGVLPFCGVGNNLPLWFAGHAETAPELAILVGMLSSVTLDFSARHKVGGTHLNFFIAEQLPVLTPGSFTASDQKFASSRVLELTYTSNSLHQWARDLGYAGQPFSWDQERRALLRAELDVLYARKYGLSRDELRYVLDPADVKGASYPSETFRVLKNKEEIRYGEYRTRRLVLEAWDRLGNI